MDKKLIVAYIGDKEPEWLRLSLSSVIDIADKVVFIWGTEDVKTLAVLEEFKTKYPDKLMIIARRYEHELIGANGRARGAYLKILQEQFDGNFALVLDPDEVVDNLARLKEDIKVMPNGIYNVKMRHTIRTLMDEDSTLDKHWCPGRLFSINKDLFYPESEHPVLSSEVACDVMNYDKICIWHFAYSKDMIEIKKKYDTHRKKSEIHSLSFLRQWYAQHILGLYPTKKIDTNALPPVIIKHFELENINEQIYFQRRMGLETKHFLDAINWRDAFRPNKALDIGCGVGLRLFAMNELGIETYGIEISKWAVENTPFKKYQDKLFIAKVEDMNFKAEFDFIYAYDILEHLEEKDLSLALANIEKAGTKFFLFSIPFKGDPNYELDHSHKICHERAWWEEQINKAGIKVIETPEHFLFKEQLILGVK
jgi:2-polyprenyl-3-methyl-5-hydroxy-6-metoxy-1,4-benzoquinol methylase